MVHGEQWELIVRQTPIGLAQGTFMDYFEDKLMAIIIENTNIKNAKYFDDVNINCEINHPDQLDTFFVQSR